MEDYIEQLKLTLNAVWALGGETDELFVDEPATLAEIVEAERKLRRELPKEFKQVLLTVSSQVRFSWFLPDRYPLPEGLKEIFSGRLEWGIDQIFQNEGVRIDWVYSNFPNEDDPYHRVWHDKLAFQRVGNGDFLSFDLSDGAYGRVVYLSHEYGQGHGYVLGTNFMDFLNRWVPLGCPGPEEWQWLPFTKDKESGIDPQCTNAAMWKQTLFGEDV